MTRSFDELIDDVLTLSPDWTRDICLSASKPSCKQCDGKGVIPDFEHDSVSPCKCTLAGVFRRVHQRYVDFDATEMQHGGEPQFRRNPSGQGSYCFPREMFRADFELTCRRVAGPLFFSEESSAEKFNLLRAVVELVFFGSKIGRLTLAAAVEKLFLRHCPGERYEVNEDAARRAVTTARDRCAEEFVCMKPYPLFPCSSY